MSNIAPAEAPVAEGRLEEIGDGMIVLGLPGTDYRVHLVCAQPPAGAKVRDRVRGTITANARRVDVVPSGGRYIEPVFGRPRRVQGRVIGGDPQANTITVDCVLPLVCKLTDPRQKVGDFSLGQFVSFDVERGATFHPMNKKE